MNLKFNIFVSFVWPELSCEKHDSLFAHSRCLDEFYIQHCISHFYHFEEWFISQMLSTLSHLLPKEGQIFIEICVCVILCDVPYLSFPSVCKTKSYVLRVFISIQWLLSVNSHYMLVWPEVFYYEKKFSDLKSNIMPALQY